MSEEFWKNVIWLWSSILDRQRNICGTKAFLCNPGCELVSLLFNKKEKTFCMFGKVNWKVIVKYL